MHYCDRPCAVCGTRMPDRLNGEPLCISDRIWADLEFMRLGEDPYTGATPKVVRWHAEGYKELRPYLTGGKPFPGHYRELG